MALISPGACPGPLPIIDKLRKTAQNDTPAFTSIDVDRMSLKRDNRFGYSNSKSPMAERAGL